VLSLSSIYWLNAITVAWAMLPGFLFLSSPKLVHKQMLTLALATIFVFIISFGVWRLDEPMPPVREDVQIHLVQSNIPQADKWKRENFWKHFMMHIEQSRPSADAKSVPTYIVWSETALSQWVLDEPQAIKVIKDTLSQYKAPAYLITGLLRYETDTHRFYNSMVMIDKFGDISNVYDKNHLVPFGEYVPFQEWIPLEPVAQFRGFAGGGGIQTLQTPEGIKYSPVICYEIIFSGAVAKHDNPPDFILNVTNDSWYGDTAGPRQHLEQAVFRAIEEGIPVVRVADTGISAIVDSRGQIVDKSELFTEYTKTLALPGKTVVSRRNKIINEGLLLLVLSFFISLGIFSKRKI
jgi:apolipoprotein N-acyltransferase